MNRSKLHPLEVAILLAVLVLEAAVLLLRAALVPAVALVLTLLQWSPAAPAAAAEPPPAPAPHWHPLALLATQLQELTAADLRQLAGIRSKRHSKHQLIALGGEFSSFDENSPPSATRSTS